MNQAINLHIKCTLEIWVYILVVLHIALSYLEYLNAELQNKTVYTFLMRI